MTKILLSAVLLLCVQGAIANVITAKGQASVTYTEPTASSATKAATLFNAQMKAVEYYYAEAGDAATENLDAIRTKIKEDPDRFILETTILVEEDRPDLHRYTIVVRLTLNGSTLNLALRSTSVTGATPEGERSQLVCVFVSRQIASSRVFDSKVYKQADAAANVQRDAGSSTNGSEGETVLKSQVSTNASRIDRDTLSVKSSTSVETGGSTTRKTTIETWHLLPSQNLNQTVTKVFKTSGYRVVDAQMVETIKMAAIEADYASGNDLHSATLQTAVTEIRKARVRYLAIGTLDVGQSTTDSATGLQRVSVTVNAKIYDTGQTFAESVAVSGPTQYSGVGPTDDEAQTGALKIAAESTARDLVSQLANAGLR